jgi:hypothetical protein
MGGILGGIPTSGRMVWPPLRLGERVGLAGHDRDRRGDLAETALRVGAGHGGRLMAGDGGCRWRASHGRIEVQLRAFDPVHRRDRSDLRIGAMAPDDVSRILRETEAVMRLASASSMLAPEDCASAVLGGGLGSL